jgi:hypothetical protein
LIHMRPIQKITATSLSATSPVQLLLIQATGEYCQLCECRLTDVSHAMDKRTMVEHDGTINPEDWPYYLLLCESCFRRHLPLEGASAQLLYPDEAITFSLDRESSPYLYEMHEVKQVMLDEEGKAVIEPLSTEAVLVRGTTEAAQNTLAQFNLNGGYDSGSETLQIRLDDGLPLDIRVKQRTDSWNIAADYVNRYRQVLTLNPSFGPLMIQHGRMLAAASGNWSVWATVLWELRDRGVLSAILMPLGAGGGVSPEALDKLEPDESYPGTNPKVFG